MIGRAPAILVVLLTSIMAGGCFTEKRAQKAFGKVAEKFPEIPAEYCADKYPVKVDTVTGFPVTTFDTLYVGEDPIFDTAFINDTFYITERHKTVMKITKTVEITIRITEENTARVKQFWLEKESAVRKLDQATKDLSEAKTKNKTRFWIIIAMGAVIVMLGWGKIQSGWTKVTELFTKFKI